MRLLIIMPIVRSKEIVIIFPIFIGLALFLAQGCSTTPPKSNDSQSAIDTSVPANICRLSLRVERWHPSQLMDITAHRFVYKLVKIFNCQNSEVSVILLKHGVDFDLAEVDLGLGSYKIQSIVVEDEYAKHTRSVSNVPYIRDVKLDIEIIIEDKMLGKTTKVEFAPQKINDFTITKYKTI